MVSTRLSAITLTPLSPNGTDTPLAVTTAANPTNNDIDEDMLDILPIATGNPITLLDLPLEILDNIFSYVGFKKVSQTRLVSRQMNQVCSSILNSRFTRLQTQMMARFQAVKAKMPRR